MTSLKKKIKKYLSHLTDSLKEQSIDKILRELEEMENGFALVVCANLIGLPTPFSLLSLRLLPFLEREINIMLSKSTDLDDKLATWTDIVDL